MSNITTYTLMNKNTPILLTEYSLDTHTFTDVTKIYSIAAAPPAIILPGGGTNVSVLNSWWIDRAISNGRYGLSVVMDTLKLWDTRELLEAAMGLSLSDRYWLCDGKHSWDEVNFFAHSFPDALGTLTLQPEGVPVPVAEDIPLFDPNASLGGCMEKCWRAGESGNERLLYKRSLLPDGLDAYGEAVATALHTVVMRTGQYVPYTVQDDKTGVYSVCANMLREDEELVPAYAFIAHAPRKNTFEDIAGIFSGTGIPGVREFLNKMFLCDFLLGNFDRHYNNFGAIRNVETLEYVRMAPIFDSGNALWWAYGSHVVPENSAEFYMKPFECRERGNAIDALMELPDPSALPEDLSRFYDTADRILDVPWISAEHRERILNAIRHQEQYVRQADEGRL